MRKVADSAIIEQLQKQIIKLKMHETHSAEQPLQLSLGMMKSFFPGNVFTKVAVHELIIFINVLTYVQT